MLILLLDTSCMLPAAFPSDYGQREACNLEPAVRMFVAQGGQVSLRKPVSKIHDRYVFCDRHSGYHSGASFKDGAVKAPTTLTQITDAFSAVLQTYEGLWTSAQVIL
jgi:hypothetical protein